MKRLLLFAVALLILLTACSLDSTVGELIDPNYKNDGQGGIVTTIIPDDVYYAPNVPDRLKYLFERMDDYEVLGITTEYLEDYLNDLDFDLMEEDVYKWVRQKYEGMCEAAGKVPQVTYFPFIISCRDIEAFYGPEIESNVNNVVVGDKIYTAEWVYRHTIRDYEAAGITPQMLEEKIYYYQGFPFNGVAQPFFERKLSAFLGHEVSLELEEERIPGKEYGVIYNMPAPFEYRDGTELPEYWRYPVNEEQLHVPAYLSELVPREDYDEWFHSFGAYSTIENPTINDFPNVVSFVRYFDYCITDEDILTAYEDPLYNQNDHDKVWYDKLAQTLTLRSDYDGVYVNMYIGAYAIVVDGKYIYTPEWVYNHSIAGWEMAGITPELITEKLGYYDDYSFTDEARIAFEYKLKYFLGYDVSLDKKQNFSAMVVNGVTYDLEWLSTHTIQDYQAEGITIGHLESFLEYIQPYWGDSHEYEWIESAYLRMCENAGLR